MRPPLAFSKCLCYTYISGRDNMSKLEIYKNLISPKKTPDKQFFLDLCDEEKGLADENARVRAVLDTLKALYIRKIQLKINAAKAERDELLSSREYDAAKYRRVTELGAEINRLEKKRDEYKPFFAEPYFARMDLEDGVEGYNSYYIGKRGDEGLEIVDWRAPLARRYYQKSRLNFTINEYDYKVVLRRALRTQNGKVLSIKNEYLSLKDYLSKEEMPARGEEVIFDPFLKEILRERKEKEEICDIIETIQEKQYEIITLPEDDEFVLQGVAGSGKTMIMLHRLSYIMYNNDALKPSDVLVLTPSDSFNAFIDELSAVLELEKVRTSTLENYFFSLLKSVGIDGAAKLDYSITPSGEYLSYIYSARFKSDVEKRLSKIFDGVYGMFASSECAQFCAEIAEGCKGAVGLYDDIKNSSLRVRRCVLGEIKEKPDGGLYYTKPFRNLFNCVYDVQEFMSLSLTDGKMKNQAYFYRQLLSFYKSMRFIRRNAQRICRDAENDLNNLAAAVEKEIHDLKRYKINVGGQEVLTYSERIAKRGIMLDEIRAICKKVQTICSVLADFAEFAQVLRGEKHLVAIGKCESIAEIASFFYRETVKKSKEKFGVPTKGLCRSDPFAIALILSELGFELSPKFAFMFVDEAQDISAAEYEVLRKVNTRAAFNIFGDLQQNITPYRGVSGWECLNLKNFNLNLNYRNTNQIVEFVANELKIDMQSIGFEGDPVEFIDEKKVSAFFADKKGLRAIICSEAAIGRFNKKGYSVLRQSGKISKTAINIMTVYESKGLEFTAVAVVDGDMTENEKYIAYTRALKNLAIVR